MTARDVLLVMAGWASGMVSMGVVTVILIVVASRHQRRKRGE